MNAPDLPPRIGIDRPGSFSRAVFHDRHPDLLADLLADVPYPRAAADALEALLEESLHGRVPARVPDGPEHRTWKAEIARRAGQPWSALPFLWAEAYFYRRLLDAAAYFDPASPWPGVDPFALRKRAQLDGPELRADLDAYTALAGGDRRRELLYAALWGNQADLGFRTGNPGAHASRDGDVVADDSDVLFGLLDAPGDAPVVVVADNAGRELTADLAFIDSLVATGTGTVELHLKPHPYFVSDATGHDVLAVLDALGGDAHEPVRALGERLREAIRAGRLRLRAHGAYLLPTEYRETAVEPLFTGAKVVILKGDLNYRRLVGDREWDPATPFAETVDYFPAPVAALRTAKSDLAVGIPADRLAGLENDAPDWRVSGTHAVIQVRA